MNKKFKIILISFLIIIFSWYIFLFEPNNLQIEELNIKIENLPSSFEGAKIVQLSDFHTKKFGKKEKEILEIIDRLNPDYIFVTGDFVTKTTKNIEPFKEFWQIAGEKYKNKIYAVLGNHDDKNSKTYLIKQTLIDNGIVVLDNENIKLSRDDDYIYLIGVDDPNTGKDDLGQAMKNINNEDIPKILLAHSPEIIEEIKGKNINLIFAGHTHGGQVKLPFIRPFWVPTKYHGKYCNGLFKLNSTYLYVNRGIGTVFLPARLNCSPEITLINLEK